MFKILLIVILLPMVQSAGQVAVGDGFKPIHNDTFWNTSDGRPLYSQGGGIFRFADPQTGRERY